MSEQVGCPIVGANNGNNGQYDACAICGGDAQNVEECAPIAPDEESAIKSCIDIYSNFDACGDLSIEEYENGMNECRTVLDNSTNVNGGVWAISCYGALSVNNSDGTCATTEQYDACFVD